MGWFSKKKEVEEQEEVPKLPELPEQNNLVLPSKEDLPELSRISNKDKELPEIKTDETDLPRLPEPEFGFQEPIKKPITKPQEMQKSKFSPLPKVPFKKPEHEIKPEPMLPTQPPKIKEKPIYIRLDKFEATEESFEEIKNKLIEIESFLKKIREIKTKEEQELEDWEREIQVIKTRIESIDKNIFNKLD